MMNTVLSLVNLANDDESGVLTIISSNSGHSNDCGSAPGGSLMRRFTDYRTYTVAGNRFAGLPYDLERDMRAMASPGSTSSPAGR